MNRREFILGAAGLASATALAEAATAPATPATPAAPSPLATSEPVLHNPSDTSICVAWAVSASATGWVDVSTKADMSNAVTTRCCSRSAPLAGIDDRVLTARIEGLSPATRYYYRIITHALDISDCYNPKHGATEIGTVHSFTTTGKSAQSSFAVINDTHEYKNTIRALSAKIAQLSPAATVVNGDVFGQCSSKNKAAEVLLEAAGTGYAKSVPIHFVPGNHDHRGAWCRNLDTVILPRAASERDAKFAALGRNWAVRQGDIAMVGLDTGEDKADWTAVWAGLAAFEPYRELQAEWLKCALEREDIASAPYLVVFCHIPLFDRNPDSNPGDLDTGWAAWQRNCARMWGPLLKKHGAQLVVSAHQHKFSHDPATAERPWAQIIGGGPDITCGDVTCIHGKVADGKLVVTVHELVSKTVRAEYSFPPRRSV